MLVFVILNAEYLFRYWELGITLRKVPSCYVTNVPGARLLTGCLICPYEGTGTGIRVRVRVQASVPVPVPAGTGTGRVEKFLNGYG